MEGQHTAAQVGNLSWEEYFLLIASITSLRSKDPRTKVGAVIVNQSNHILGTGYNGFVAGVDESLFSWKSEGPWQETKYPYVVHAELNAIMNSTASDLRGCRIFSTLFPCYECAKAIAQKAINEVVYLNYPKSDRDSQEATDRIFRAAQIKIHRGSLSRVRHLLPAALEGHGVDLLMGQSSR